MYILFIFVYRYNTIVEIKLFNIVLFTCMYSETSYHCIIKSKQV